MNDIPTPRTDSVEKVHPDDVAWTLPEFVGVVDSEYARSLERELAQANARIEALKEVRLFTLCPHCNKEHPVKLAEERDAWYSTYHKCPHCENTVHLWIKLMKPEALATLQTVEGAGEA